MSERLTCLFNFKIENKFLHSTNSVSDSVINCVHMLRLYCVYCYASDLFS